MSQRWQCFAHQTEWSGHLYFSWRNSNQGAEREDDTGNGLDVDPTTFRIVLDQAIDAVRAKRRELEKEINHLKA
jgi:hypothetical protein